MKHSLKLFAVLAISLGVTMSMNSTTNAADGDAKIDFSNIDISGTVTGNQYIIDQAFAEKNDIAVPAAFEFVAPTQDDQLIFIHPAPGGSSIFKVHFLTTDKKVKSNIEFVPLTIGMAALEDRLEASKNFLNDAYVRAVPNTARAEVNSTRFIKIGEYSAAELIGRFDSGADGIVVKRLVAILNPDNENGMFVEINAVSETLKMKHLAEVLVTNASRALSTFKFK